MIKYLSKILGVLVLSICLMNSAYASGKLEVDINEEVRLIADSRFDSATYKWVVLYQNEIINTQTTRNFIFKFPYQGEYTVRLTATNTNQLETIPVQNTTLYVLVGERYPRPAYNVDGVTGEEDGFVLKLETLPLRDSDQVVRLLGDRKLMFDLSKSTGTILEYRIDRNIFEDSDGNGVANDDIDNASDDSYLIGAPWVTTYELSENSNVVAEVTLVSDTGEKLKEQVSIQMGTVKTVGNPVALLDVLPYPHQQDQTVYLSESSRSVGFYAGRSTGNILEYRIDQNIFVDSNGDGDPTNDIDNLNDISFKNGDVWVVEYPETEDQIIAQLIVVGQGGKGSLVQRQLVFGDGPSLLTTDSGETVIRLEADKPVVQVGDPVLFTVQGLQQSISNYLFEWDLDGDDVIDKETEGTNTLEHIYAEPGVFEATVTIRDRDGNFALKTFEITSKEPTPVVAQFDYEANDLTVSFTNQTVALEDSQLRYSWSFGDPDEENYLTQESALTELNPTYTYSAPGSYLVTLTASDGGEQTDTYSTEVLVGNVIPSTDNEVTQPTDSTQADEPSDGSFIGKLIKILLYFILGILVLILFGVLTTLLLFKAKHPDLTFGEVIDEMKHKFGVALGMHDDYDMERPVEESEPMPESSAPQENAPETPATPEQTVEPAPEPTQEAEPEPEVIEGEVVEDSNGEANGGASSSPNGRPDSGNHNTASDTTNDAQGASEPQSEKGPVPDWLKGV